MERYDLMGIPYASGDRAGVLRTANAVDEKNSGCTDAAITPSNLHNVLGYRKANTAYAGNEIVACPYHAEFMLKCTQAGTTSTGSLDTTSATLGKVYTDGGVKWEVIVLPVEFGGTGATTAENVRKNLELNRKSFNSITQLGLSGSPSVADICTAMPTNSTFCCYVSANEVSAYGVPQNGMLCIEKMNNQQAACWLNKYGEVVKPKAWFANWSSGIIPVWKEIAHVGKLSMPNSVYMNLNIASGETYTAPADGWISLCSLGEVELRCQESGIATKHIGVSDWNAHVFLPLSKGQTANIEYTGTLKFLRFAYSLSEV